MRGMIRALQRRLQRPETRLLFAFPGGAGAWPGMGRTMFREHAPFRETVYAAGAVVEENLHWSPVPWFEGVDDPTRDPQVKRRNEIIHLGVLQVAQADLWRAEGVRPHGVLGISLGEITGPYAAGATSLVDTVRVITAVSHVVSSNRDEGLMFVVNAGRDEALRLTRDPRIPVQYLGTMGPRASIMLGSQKDVEAIRVALSSLIEREIPTSWQYHTPSLGEHRFWLRERLAGITSELPSCPIYSSAAGGRLPADAVFDHQFFAWMFTHPFRYAEAVRAALDDRLETIVNLGPGPMNSASIRATADESGRKVTLIDTMMPNHEAAAWRRALPAVRRLRIAPRPAPAPQSVSPDYGFSRFERYEELRRSGPLHYMAEHRRWVLIGYDEVQRALNDAETFSSDMAELRRIDPVLLGSDPPQHDEARRILSRLFSAEELARRSALVQRTATALLQPLAEERMLEVVHDFAQPLILTVAADLLGLQPSQKTMLETHAVHLHTDLTAVYPKTREAAAELARGARIFPELLRDLGDETAALSLMQLLWIAGTTPQHSLAHGVLALLEQPAIRRAVTEDRTALPAFVDEVLRLRPPADRVPRLVTRDVTVAGTTIPAGDIVELCLAAANRDPRQFNDPAALRLDRPANPHLSFGGGVHRCIGAALGKAVLVNALDSLLNLAPDFQSVQPLFAVRHVPGATLHQIEQLVIAS